MSDARSSAARLPARRDDTGKPFAASFCAGSTHRRNGSLPHRRTISPSPRTSPGTATASPPRWDSSATACPSFRYAAGVIAAGARSRASSAYTFFSLAMYTSANAPPPIPDDSGCRTPSASAVAQAASTALPPALSAATPAAEASGLSDATAACAAVSGGVPGPATLPGTATATGTATSSATTPKRIKPEPRVARVISERYQG